MRRIYRRVCELRAIGRADEAVQLENSDLPAALAAARRAGVDVDESALFAGEDERVADALLLAELLAPMLASRLPSAPRLPAAGPPSAPARASRSRTASSPQVADLIDDMLAQAAARSQRT